MKKKRTLSFALALLLVLTMFTTTSMIDPESEVRAASESEEAVIDGEAEVSENEIGLTEGDMVGETVETDEKSEGEPAAEPAEGSTGSVTEPEAEPTESAAAPETKPAESVAAPSSEPATPAAAPEEPSTGQDKPAVAPIINEPATIQNTVDNYDKGVWLHVVTGNFTGKYKVGDEEEADISNQPSVWVEFKEGTRCLPDYEDLPHVKRTHGEFEGWYTKAPTETKATDEAGGFDYWHTVQKNGEKIEGEKEVPEGVTVLYAAFDDSKEIKNEDKLITYYLDYNGMFDMYGHCVTCTGAYSDEKKFTAEKAAVYGFNFDNSYGKNTAVTWEGLKEFWGKKEFNGYKFLGWSTEEKGESVIDADTPIKNGMSFYAHWEKGDSSNESYEKTDPTQDPISFIYINSALSQNVHAAVNSSIRIDLSSTPLKAAPNNLTWTLVFGDGTLIGTFKPKTVKVTVGEPYNKDDTEGTGFKAEAVGKSLIITNLDGKSHGFHVSATEQTSEGALISTPADASVGFTHNVSKWEETKAASCSEAGQKTGTCDVCKQTVTQEIARLTHVFNFVETKAPTCTEAGLKEKKCIRCGATYEEYLTELIPPMGHTYKVVSKAVTDGVPIYTEECIHEDDTKTVMGGDANGDGEVSAVDVSYLFKVVSGQIDDSLETVVGDANGDGEISAVDVSYLFKFVSGQIDSMGE